MVADTAGKLGYKLDPLPALRRKWLWMMTQAEWVADRLKARWARFSLPRSE
jgi:hypothetical protein